MHSFKYWILWLLLWQIASCSADNGVVCGPTAVDATIKSATKSAGIIVDDEHVADDTPFGLSLHAYIYNGDFIGFKKQISVLSRHENFPSLLGALQAGDDRGITVVHLLACAGRHNELSNVVDVLFRMQGEGVEMIRRIVLETRNDDACRGKNCDLSSDRPGLYAHGTLHLRDPPQQVVLFGNVTPLECAAAHGHVQAMKRLIQCGVEAGRAFEIAKIFSLTKHLHQAIQLAHTEGFLAQPKVHLPSSSKSATTLQRQCTIRASDTAQDTHSSDIPGSSSHGSVASKRKEKGVGGRSKQKSKQTPTEVAKTAAAVLMTVSGAAEAGSTPMSSSTASSDPGTSTGANTSKSTKLAEVLDIAALLLLTGMLLLPLWSTVCLLWRRAMRRRAAITEPARKIKQALFSATLGSAMRSMSSTSSRDNVSDCSSGAVAAAAAGSSSGSSSAAGQTTAGVKKGKASLGTLGRQRKAPVNQQKSNTATAAVAKPKVLIPMTVSCDDSDQAPAGCEEQQQLKPDVVPNDQLPHDSVMPPGQARSSSDPGTAALSSVPPQTTTACAASNRIKPNTAAIYRSTSDVVKSVSKSNKRNKQQASSAVGGDSGVSSAIDAPSLGALYNSSDEKTHPGSVATASSKSDLSMTSSVPQQQTVTAVDDRPEPSSKHVVPTPTKSASCAADNAASNTSAGSNTSVSIPAQTASKRRTTGSRSVATSATAVKSHKDASQTPTAHNQIKTTSASSTSRRQLANRATSPVKAARSRPRASKSAGGAVGGTAAAAAAAAAVDSFNRGKRGGLHAAQRTVSAGPTSGLYEPLLLSPAELRALSADDAAQAARAYAALITPYTPSASAAATRPAIYQPPGAKDGSSSNSASRPIEADAGDVRGAQLRGMAKSDADSKVQQLKAELAANHDVDDVISCARDQDLGADASVTDFGADVSPYATALHIPADSGTLGGSADFEDTPPALSVCFSSPAALANEHSMGSSSSNSSSPKDLPSLQSQLSSSYSLGPICSSAEGSVPEAFNAAYLSSSSSICSAAAGAVCGPFKVSNAASLLSESSMPSSGMLEDTTAAFAAQLPPPPPTTPSTAASRPITAATADRFGASTPDALADDGMLSPARALSGTCGSKEGGLPSAAAATTTAIGSERPEMTHDTARSDTFAPQVVHLSVPQQNGTQLLSSSSSSARDAEQQLSALADVATADNIRSVASRTASGGSWSSGSVVTQGAGAQNAAVVLGSGDAEIPFQRRQSVSGPVCCSGLSEQMGFMTSVPQQQQEAATHSIRAIAQTLLQQPLPGASDAQAVQLSPEAVAQMVSRWHQQQQQQQQQQQMVARAQQQQQQQQRMMASIPQSAAWHEQQAAQQVLQVPAAAMHGGVQQVQLPASMLALMQASKHQAAVHQAAVQQQQQQHAQSQTLPQQQQQQKLMLFVPQQSGVQLVSPTNNSYTALSPQQCAVMLSPVAGVPAMQLMQQQQQQSAVSALPYAQQVQGAYLQQQQLQGVLQGGSVRVVYTADGRLHVQPHAIVANVSQGNNHHYTSAPMAMSMPSASAAALLPSHMSTPGGLHLPSGVQQQQQQQQLLALMQPTQPGIQQAVQGGHSPTGFDWSSLASELSGGRVSTVVDAGSGEAADQTMLLRALASSSAVDAAAGGSSVGGTSVVSQSQQRLSVVVPESGSAGEQQKNESARMAAELDELLHQANQQLGWSGIPRPSDGDGVAAGRDHDSKAPTALPGMTSNFNMPAPTTADALLCQVGTYALQADAPEYQPSVLHAVGSQVSDTVCGGTASSEGKNVRLKNLEALQLPDGFCSGD